MVDHSYFSLNPVFLQIHYVIRPEHMDNANRYFRV
jgi:hypothetical protein